MYTVSEGLKRRTADALRHRYALLYSLCRFEITTLSGSACDVSCVETWKTRGEYIYIDFMIHPVPRPLSSVSLGTLVFLRH